MMMAVVMTMMMTIAMRTMVMRKMLMLHLQANDLVFIKNSPDYCHSNHTIGSLGEHHYDADDRDNDGCVDADAAKEEGGYSFGENNNIEFTTRT